MCCQTCNYGPPETLGVATVASEDAGDLHRVQPVILDSGPPEASRRLRGAIPNFPDVIERWNCLLKGMDCLFWRRRDTVHNIIRFFGPSYICNTAKCFSQHHTIPASLTYTLVRAVTLCTLLATYHGYSIASRLFGDGGLCTLLSTHHGYWSTDSHSSLFSTPLTWIILQQHGKGSEI